jgi:uncharacterized membrane protein
MAEPKATSPPPTADGQEPVWTYRGYKMKPGEFNTAMVHFYRGEISRANTWRGRLDSTTNWAVVTVAAILTFAFGAAENPQVVILLGILLVCVFLIIESRRYRYYELWALRVRLMETDFFAAMLTPPFAPHQEWATRVADSLLTPKFPITYREAIGRRLRRNYIWLFLILGGAWVVKLMLNLGPSISLNAFVNNAAVGFIPGYLVIAWVVTFFLGALVVAIVTARLQDSAGEVLPRVEVLDLSSDFLQGIASAASQVLHRDISIRHRHEHLTFIITEKPEEVSQQLFSFLDRGVTALQGQGMYTHQPRSVLLCAVTPAETDHLKAAVYAVDEDAFIVINAAEEILGAGFEDLQPRWRQQDRETKDSNPTKQEK